MGCHRSCWLVSRIRGSSLFNGILFRLGCQLSRNDNIFAKSLSIVKLIFFSSQPLQYMWLAILPLMPHPSSVVIRCRFRYPATLFRSAYRVLCMRFFSWRSNIPYSNGPNVSSFLLSHFRYFRSAILRHSNSPNLLNSIIVPLAVSSKR